MDSNSIPPHFDLENEFYGMDDREIEEIEIARMEGNDGIPNLRNLGTPSSQPSQSSRPTGSSAASTSCPSKKPKSTKNTTSRCWEFFDVEWKEEVDGRKSKFAKCKFCKKVLSANATNGTRHLIAHGEKCAAKHLGGREPTQSNLKFNSDGSVSTFNYDPMVARESLARLIVSTDLPINFGESSFYEEHIQRSFCPQFKKVSRNTTRSDLITYYNKLRTALISNLNSNNFCIALTSDIWAAKSNQDYLSVVSHYLDCQWILQKRIIGFRLIDRSHNAFNITTNILSVLSEFGITNRIIAITLDNASANTKAMESLENELNQYMDGRFLLHQRCACHIINLIVKSGMKLVNDNISNIRNALLYINNTNSRITEFKRYCEAGGLKPRKFGTDMPIRWNSTYLMLKDAIGYKNVISMFYNTRKNSILLSDVDWFIAEKMVDFLETFYDATVVLSGVYYPTSPLVFTQLMLISSLFAEYRNDDLFQLIVARMEKKFNKYWDHKNMPLLYCLAVILHPHVKLSGLFNGLTHISEHMNIDYASTYSSIYANTENKLVEFYNLYQNKFGQQVPNPETEQVPKPIDRKKKKVLGFFSAPARRDSSISSGSSASANYPPGQASSTQHNSPPSELTKYLETDFSLLGSDTNAEDFKILDWWRLQSGNFPVLSRLARDILTIPVSTVSSESAFSTAGRIIEDRRTSLTPQMVELLTCLRDWEHAAKRMQYTVQDDEITQHFKELTMDDDVNV